MNSRDREDDGSGIVFLHPEIGTHRNVQKDACEFRRMRISGLRKWTWQIARNSRGDESHVHDLTGEGPYQYEV
jgi:hypothetical protein